MPVDRKEAEQAIDAFLRAIGRDPSAEPALAGTAARVTAAYVDELCEGYAVDAARLLRDGAIDGHTALVVLRDCPVTTMCPHHLLPATGLATVAFAPGTKLVGLGVLAEVVDAFAHRLALQEEVGNEVAKAVHAELGARWAACRLVMSHACVTARGERKHGATVETVAFAGEPRDELMALGVVRS